VELPLDAVIGGENGFKVMMNGLNSGRIGIAALCCGIARAAIREAVNYANERVAFGSPIANLQAIQFKIADMVTSLEAAELLTLKAAWIKDSGKNYMEAASMAKVFASEMVNRVTAEALQIHGGNGYVREYLVEKLYRDARITTIYEGTSEIQRLVIGRGVLKKGFL
jgi:alkylation response protein AidB-like acyl-CoA dehydrogenase